MSIFLDPRGKSTFGIGICARCSRKMSLEDLSSDPNYPGLYVCAEDKDQFDPYRLAARQPERISLFHPRPDTNIALNMLGTISQDDDLFIIGEEGDGYLVP
jgi:hypothetical protein